jgi:phosphopantothenoylcysteine decarboxylase/phosphopantothenate--cysteine ligase
VLGAEVTVVSAAGTGLTFVRDVKAETTTEFLDAVLGELSSHEYDAYVSAAAIGDYAAEPAGEKIRSGMKTLSLELKPTPKVIDEVRKNHDDLFIVGFKAETGGSDEDLCNAANGLIKRGVADMVVANDVAANPMGGSHNRVLITDGKMGEWHEGDKAAVARHIAGLVASRLK